MLLVRKGVRTFVTAKMMAVATASVWETIIKLSIEQLIRTDSDVTKGIEIIVRPWKGK